jgi:hypothetical protein
VVPALRLRGRCAGHGDRGWRTSRWGGARRRWWSRSAATGVPAADTCGAKTPPPRRSRGRSSRGVGCGGRWKRSCRAAPDRGPGRRGLAVAWDTANDAVLAEGKRVLIDDPARFDGVRVIGVDEHVWRHTRRGDKYVTVIIDLTPSATAPAQPGCWTWSRAAPRPRSRPGSPTAPTAWRDAVEVVAMDGFTGFKTATAEELPDAVTVMDPFHVVRLAGDALDTCRRRVQQAIHGHRGRKGDPLYRARRTLHTGADLLTDKQAERLTAVVHADEHVRGRGDLGHLPADDRRLPPRRPRDRRELMVKLIDSVSTGVPTALVEVTKLGRTLKKRAADVLAYFDRPGTSNGPTEAINGRLEHLRGSALGFRNLTNYIARCLLESGGFRPQLLHPRLG